MEKEQFVQEIKTNIDFFPLALVLAIIAFWGEPDLVDALIFWLMNN